MSPTGGYAIAGYTQSTDGDVIGNHGGTDAWVASLSEPAGGLLLSTPLYNCETG